MTRLDWCHIGWGIVGLVVVAPILWMATDTRPCLTISDGAFDPPNMRALDTVTMTYTAREHMACGGYVVRRFIGSDKVARQTIQEPTNYHEILNHDERKFSVSFKIPLLPPGPSVYAPVVYRWRNPIQKFWPTLDTSVPQIAFTLLAPRVAGDDPTGPQGPQGEQGPQGRQGEPGPQGPRGP